MPLDLYQATLVSPVIISKYRKMHLPSKVSVDTSLVHWILMTSLEKSHEFKSGIIGSTLHTAMINHCPQFLSIVQYHELELK